MYVFIVNPVSGKGKGLKMGKRLDNYLRDKDINYKIIYTKKSGDAKKIAKKYSMSDNIIYSVGGDGTLNEVVNGMVFGKAFLDIIPVGSGNDFYRVFKNNISKSLDIGRVNKRYFINISSFGLDAITCMDAEGMKKHKIPSKFIYAFSLIKNFIAYKPLKISIDDKECNITILTICNGSYYGGGFKIAPHAILNDGKFEVIESFDINKFQVFKLLLKIPKGRHIYDDKINTFSCDKISIRSKKKLCCNVDGEIIYGKNFEYVLHKDAIKVHLNDELGLNKLLR